MTKIYILHGWAYDTVKWEPFIKLLNNAGFKPVVLKVPGLTAPLNRAYSVDDYLDWLNQELKSASEPVIVFGHSNGGRLALWYAIFHPEKIRHLVLIDSAGIYHGDLLTVAKRKVFKLAANMGKKITKSEGLRNLLYRLSRTTDYRDASLIMRQTMTNLLSADCALDPAKVKAPTTIIWGGSDRVTPLSDGRKLHRLIKNSTFNVISGARHAPFATHSKEVFEIIRKELFK